MHLLKLLLLNLTLLSFSCTGGSTVAVSDDEDSTGGTSTSSGDPANTNPGDYSSLDGAVSIQLNSGASYTSTLNVTVNISANGYSRVYLTETAGCASGGTWEGFTSSQAQFTLSTADAETVVYAKFSDINNAESECVSATIIHDAADPTTPSSFDDGFGQTSITETPTLTWGASTDSRGIAGYEIAIGTAQGGTDILDWVDVGDTTSVTLSSGFTLTDGNTYYASVRAVDNSGRTSTAAEGDGWIADAITCPSANGTFIPVPAYPKVGINESFCIAKYEMKDVGGGVAGSQPSIVSWGSIDRPNAIAECNALDGAMSDYFIPSNAHWQAIARNIERQASNWSSNIVGTGSLNAGNKDGGGNLVADADDSNGCAGLGTNTHDAGAVTNDCGGGWHLNKRTHVLSNGEVIWDFAGNVWEFVSDNVTGDIAPSPALNTFGSDAWREFTLNDVNCGGDCFPLSDAVSTNRNFFGPEGDYDSSHGVGQMYMGDSYGGIIIRGGPYNNTEVGIFSALLYWGTSDTNPNSGFRCAWLDQ